MPRTIFRTVDGVFGSFQYFLNPAQDAPHVRGPNPPLVRFLDCFILNGDRHTNEMSGRNLLQIPFGESMRIVVIDNDRSFDITGRLNSQTTGSLERNHCAELESGEVRVSLRRKTFDQFSDMTRDRLERLFIDVLGQVPPDREERLLIQLRAQAQREGIDSENARRLISSVLEQRHQNRLDRPEIRVQMIEHMIAFRDRILPHLDVMP